MPTQYPPSYSPPGVIRDANGNIIGYNPGSGPLSGGGYANNSNQNNNQNSTIGSIYGNLFPSYDNTPDQVLNNASQNALGAYRSPVDENKIFQDTLLRYQSEIDAVNQIYGSQLKAARLKGLGDLGTSTNIAARSGTLGSPGGEAQYKNVENANLATENSIAAEQAAKIASILGTARTDASAEIKAKREAQQKGLSDYLGFLATKTERQTANIKKVAGLILGNKIDPATMQPGELDNIAKQYGVSSQEIVTEYNAQKRALADAEAKRKADAAYTLGEGQIRYDENGKVISTGGAKDNSFTLGAGEQRYDAQGNLIAAGAPKDTRKLVKINGVDYLDNGDGTYSKPDVPIVATQAARDTIQVIDDLINDPKLSQITGVGQNPFNLVGANALTLNKYNQLKGMLALQNRSQLKGQGAISDFEFKVLGEASSALGRNLSNAAFRQVLTDLKTKLETGDPNVPKAGALSSEDQLKVNQMRADNIPDDVIEQVLGRPISFNSVGNTTASIQIPATSTLAYVNNNPGNLRFVGQPGAVEGKSGFAKFKDAAAGFNALVAQVTRDAARGHTLRTFISKFAPPSENDTSTYIRQVAAALGINPATKIKEIDPVTLAKAMAFKESSTRIS